LTRLYRQLKKGEIKSYYSHPKPLGQMAEGGGGGGGRENFQNTVAFQEIETNSKGEGETEISLADNITSWRIVAIAIASGLQAGDSQRLIATSLPFFVKVTSNGEFVIGDKPKITLSAFGDILKPKATVNYEIKGEALGIKDKKISGKAFSPVDLELPELKKEGFFKLTIAAYSQGQKDAVIKPITVLKSRLSRERIEEKKLVAQQEISLPWNNKGAVHVTIANQGQAKYYRDILCLSSACLLRGGKRSDQIVARLLASQLLSQYFGEKTDTGAEQQALSSIYSTKGGFRLLPRADADPILSSKIAATRLKGIEKSQLRAYLWKQFQQEKSIERASAIVWGLAETDEKVLNITDSLLQQENTTLGKLYLGLAATALGDQTSGRIILNELMNEFGVKQESFVYLKAGKQEIDWLKATSLAAILAERVGSDFSEPMFFYLENKRVKEEVFGLEKAIWLKEALKNRSNQKVEVEYSLNGQKIKKKIGRSAVSLLLEPQEAGQFKVKLLSGQASIVGRYWDQITPKEASKEKDLKITLSSNQKSWNEPIEFNLVFQRKTGSPDGAYFVVVNLPSNLKFVNSPYLYRPQQTFSYSWPSYIENNRLLFAVYQSSDTIRFLARPVNKGHFVFEPAIVYYSHSPEFVNISNDPPDINL
jgi:hypothetical protein